MDPNASIGRDDSRNSAVRSLGPVRPPSASALLPLVAVLTKGTAEDEFPVSTRDANDDDLTLEGAISQSGERSVLMSSEVSRYDHEGPNGDVEQEDASFGGDGVTVMYLSTDVTQAASGMRSEEDMESITEAERGRRPSPQDKKAEFRSELASSREADDDVFDSREVSGSNPLPMQAIAPQGGEQRSMPLFGDKPTTHNLELAPAREQGPEDLAGRRDAVFPAASVEEHPHDGANQHDTFLQVHPQRIAPTAQVEREQQEFMMERIEHVAQPGAYPVYGIHARNDATKECHHQHRTTLPYVFIDYDKMANHSIGRFVVFLWLLCGAFAQPMKGPRKGVLVSISG